MKKVLLVHPKFPTTYWSFDHALPFVDKKASIPPLGLMTVAAMLPAEWQLRLIDLNVQSLKAADIEEAELVFLSAMIVQKQSFDEVVRLCRRLGKPVVAGGPYPISMHEQIQGVDHFVLDEAEATLPRFLEDLAAGRPQRLYRDAAKPDIASTPVPRFDLIDVSAYDTMSLQYSRGCPYNCEFCDIIEMFGRRQRTKAPEQFLREMEAVEAAGFRGSLFIVDDNFIGNRGKTKELLRHIAAWQREHGFPFTLLTEASIDLAQDDELLGLMVAAGFDMVFVGIETPDEQTLAFTQKGQNLRAGILESVRKIQHHGIEVTGGFIVGFDTDPPDIFDRQIAFIQEAGIPMAMVGLLTALPNTQLARRLEEQGRLLHDSTGNNTHTLRLNFVPRMPEDQLIDGYKRVLRTLYTPRNYFRRCATLLRELPPGAKVARKADWRGVKALLRSLAKQGVSAYGLHYLRMLAGAALWRPRLFPQAVAMAIKGHHLFALTAEILRADAFARQLADSRERCQPKVARALLLGGGRVNAALQRHIRRLLGRARRRNSSFSLEMQQHLRENVAEFARTCAIWLGRLRLARVRAG